MLPVLSTLFANLHVKHFGKPTQKGLAIILTQDNSSSLLEKIEIFVGNQNVHLVGRVRWAQGLKVQLLDERRRTMKWLNESSVLNRQLFLQRDEASSQNSRDLSMLEADGRQHTGGVVRNHEAVVLRFRQTNQKIRKIPT